MFRSLLERRATFRAGVLAGTLVALSLAVGACGGGDPQDENEPEGTYKVDVISASFPGRQRLAEETTLKITVQNKDDETIPNLGVTVDGFYQRREDADPGGSGPADLDRQRAALQLHLRAHEHVDHGTAAAQATRARSSGR